MADHTHIEWTDATWNVVTGCAVVSPGCTNCYAMKLAGTRLKHHPSRAGLTADSKAGPVWNGQVRFNEAWLTQPLRWRRPRRIFVAAHGDLFHEGVTDDQLDRIFAVMALCPQHAFQVLTKRPERMRAYLESRNPTVGDHLSRALRVFHRAGEPATRSDRFIRWPLPNVWLGVSVEDQARADERIPLLLDTPAAVRWISAEPLLGPVDLTRVIARLSFGDAMLNALEAGQDAAGRALDAQDFADHPMPFPAPAALDWVVAGGESGPGARPMHPDWARQLRDQCAAAGVPFLFKQWGDWEPRDEWAVGFNAPPMRAIMLDGSPVSDDVAPQDVGGWRMARVGKKAAGRILDGQLHDAYPEARP